jgi:hypothetical protein
MPIEIYRKRYCELFGATDEMLWLPTDRPPSRAPFSGLPISPEHASTLMIPAHLEYGDDDYLKSIHAHIHSIVTLDNRFGGTDLVRLSTRFFRSVHNQLGAGAFNPKLERDLQAGAGELAEVVGWLAYDADEHDLVRRMNQESLYFTRLAGDRTLELLTLQNSSMHAGAMGRSAEALQIARSVLEGDRSLSSRLRALFLVRKARAMAQGGDDAALRVFSEIRTLFEDGLTSTDPPWAWWIDERELHWQEAMAERDLGLTDSALGHFEESVAASPSTGVRSQYIHSAYLLRGQIEVKSWDSAEVTMRQLYPLIGEVASTRTVVLLQAVMKQLDHLDDEVKASFRSEVEQLRTALSLAPV